MRHLRDCCICDGIYAPFKSESPVSGAAPSRGEARLTGGSADPGGTWAYGRLEVSNGEFFSSVRENGSERLGRRGVQVACRSLGFSAGAQILSSSLSALPGQSGEVDTFSRIACQGDEATLADCESPSDYYRSDYGPNIDDGTVAVLCSNPSGMACCRYSYVGARVSACAISHRETLSDTFLIMS